MKITRFINGALEANCYAIDDGKSIALVDVGCFNSEIEDFVLRNKDRINLILQTHRHFDHICGVDSVKTITNAKIVIHANDECGLYDDNKSLRSLYPMYYETANKDLRADTLVSDGDIITASSMSFLVLETPGHTSGGVSYLLNDKYLFSGDTLFAGSIGRTDLESSNFSQMKQSLLKLRKLDPKIIVYPGHGNETTIEREIAENYYFGEKYDFHDN